MKYVHYSVAAITIIIALIIIFRYRIIYYISLQSSSCPHVNTLERTCKQIYVADSDMSALANTLRLNLSWEPWMLTYIKQYSNPNGIAIDIGAHIGIHSVNMAPYFKQVIAFEPNPITFRMLHKNTASIKNITLVPSAAGDYNGITHFSASAMNCQSKITDTASATNAVKIVRIDDFIGTTQRVPVSFIKIDVEGYEIQAFKGMYKIIAAYRPAIVFEDHTGANAQYLKTTHQYVITKINKTNYIAH